MIFNSLEYILFLFIIVVLYWGIKRVWLQNVLLLGAGYFFYAQWDWRFLSLILISTLSDYTIGILIGRTKQQRRRPLLLLLSVIVNLGFLSFFKYFNFFIGAAIVLPRCNPRQ